MRILRWAGASVLLLGQLGFLLHAMHEAYRIRMHPVNIFGRVIHEFDPWFNYRAAEYLLANGAEKFFTWYDYMTWYPLGRPIGTTIYPGMQFAGVWIHDLLKAVPPTVVRIPKVIREQINTLLSNSKVKELVGVTLKLPKIRIPIKQMSLNDVCVMIPPWFGSLATFFTALLASEATGEFSTGVASALIMSILPAHIMRSVGGKFDNEAVAMAPICATCWLWLRSVRTPSSWPFAIFAGMTYAFLVSSWGGYIFVCNLIGLHATLLVAAGKYNHYVWRAYTLYFVIGTFGATRIPVVGLTPLRSLETMGPFVAFLAYQVIEFCDWYRAKKDWFKPGSGIRFCAFRIAVFFVAISAVVGLVLILLPMGYFGPLGSRIRGLFVKHTRTGNPLVDSVAEHQPSTDSAYDVYLHDARKPGKIGLVFCALGILWGSSRSSAQLFVILYAAVAYHFSLKMSRLLLICAPIVSVCGGIGVGTVINWCLVQLLGIFHQYIDDKPAVELMPLRTGGMGSILRFVHQFVVPNEIRDIWKCKEYLKVSWPWTNSIVRAGIAVAVLYYGLPKVSSGWKPFEEHCEGIAHQMSNPSIMFQSSGNSGQKFIVDDYYVAYLWLRNNTPVDARVMAWWDYGYQITGIGERTSIADGNTWNHEHIATLGRALTNHEKKAHNIIRHLADYVLVWAGGRSDDLAKSPHLARIATSIFEDVCPNDPYCERFKVTGRDRNGHFTATKMMSESLLYRMVRNNLQPDVKVNPLLFKEVYQSKHGLVRIYKVLNVSKSSKDWVANPKNRICDAPGSWYCVGQYPPALSKLIAMRKNFAQLEDFNKKEYNKRKNAYSKMIEKENEL